MTRTALLLSVVTLSTSALAGNMSTNDDMTSMHSKINDQEFLKKTLENEDMRRLHRDMTLYGISEVGMEARRQMIGTKEGRAYHNAMEYK